MTSVGSGKAKALNGVVFPPADKSITHRAILFAAAAEGRSLVRANSFGRDNFASLRAIQQLGVETALEVPQAAQALAASERIKNVSVTNGSELVLTVQSGGRGSWRASAEVFDCGNSGTTSRLLCGLLAGAAFESKLDGDASLRGRPFDRVIEPLSEMGVKFSGNKLPLTIQGAKKLSGLNYLSPRASAQVKSAILLAGLGTDEEVTVIEQHCSRDHTERMFRAMGVNVVQAATAEGAWKVTLPQNTPRKLSGAEFTVPGDFSAAAFFIVGALIIPGSKVQLENVGVNATRLGLFDLLLRMGAVIQLENQREQCGEPVADLTVSAGALRGINLTAKDVVYAIDEIPILAVAAAFAEGATEIRGARELRVKESDRLKQIALLLRSVGVTVDEFDDGLKIEGKSSRLKCGAGPDEWRTSGDHRITMAGAILEYALSGRAEIADTAAVETSYPNFVKDFEALIG